MATLTAVANPPDWMFKLPPRFWEKVLIRESGCWEWLGSKNWDGYGHSWHPGKNRIGLVHRWTYEAAKGPMPAGLVTDHLCRNRACCNPQHLEAVTYFVSTHRSTNPMAKFAKRTHCAKGHPFSGENLLIRENGGRRCRTCKNEIERRQYHAGKRPKKRGL